VKVYTDFATKPDFLQQNLKYPLSYRNLKEMMIERGIQVDHSTIMRWVHQYSPEIEKKIRKHLRLTNDSWRVDETYIKVKGKWKYFYRAVDSNGDTIDFMLSAKRNRKAAKRFFKKALSSNPVVPIHPSSEYRFYNSIQYFNPA
jgi:IS6 family transposase